MTGLGTTVIAQPAFIYLTAYLGPGDASKQLAIQYQSPSSLTGGVLTTIPQQVAAGATLVAFNLATLFDAPPVNPLFIAIADITNPGVGFNISTVSGSGKISIGANGVYTIINPSSVLALPTVYIDNASSVSVLNLAFSLIGN
jgi:hypothetical protein